jgi:hypothetical protein
MLSPQAKSRPPRRRTATSNWRDVYFAAVLESDRKRALVKIESARKVLSGRLLELQSAPRPSSDELRDLNSALTYLDILFSCIAEDPPGARMAAVA